MWIVERLGASGSDGERSVIKTFHLVADEYPVGRKQAKGISVDERSVSREHANVIVSKAGSDGTQACTLRDPGSKFGTVLGGARLERNTDYPLQDGNVVTVGVTEQIRFRQFTPVLCASSLRNAPAKTKRLAALAQLVGARLSTNWSDACTHLVTNDALVVTVKLVTALACARPVVTLGWLEAVAARPAASDPLPDPAAFLPVGKAEGEATETDAKTDDVLPRPERQHHFAGKTFVLVPPDAEVSAMARAAGGAVLRGRDISDADFDACCAASAASSSATTAAAAAAAAAAEEMVVVDCDTDSRKVRDQERKQAKAQLERACETGAVVVSKAALAIAIIHLLSLQVATKRHASSSRSGARASQAGGGGGGGGRRAGGGGVLEASAPEHSQSQAASQHPQADRDAPASQRQQQSPPPPPPPEEMPPPPGKKVKKANAPEGTTTETAPAVAPAPASPAASDSAATEGTPEEAGGSAAGTAVDPARAPLDNEKDAKEPGGKPRKRTHAAAAIAATAGKEVLDGGTGDAERASATAEGAASAAATDAGSEDGGQPAKRRRRGKAVITAASADAPGDEARVMNLERMLPLQEEEEEPLLPPPQQQQRRASLSLSTAGGWLVSRKGIPDTDLPRGSRSRSLKQTQQSQAVTAPTARDEVAGSGGEEDDGATDTKPEVEVRCLIVSGNRRADEDSPYSSLGVWGAYRSGGGGSGGGTGGPDFKKFHKNSVLFGGAAAGDSFVPLDRMRAVLPKESERERQLAEEREQLEEDEREHEELFRADAAGRGGRGRVRGGSSARGRR